MRDPKEIGKVVRELRGNLSLRDFAKKCEISHTTIDNIEKGIDFRTGKPVQIKMNTIKKIANACGVSISYLIGEPSLLDWIREREQAKSDSDISMIHFADDDIFSANAVLLSAPKIYSIPVYESVSAGFGAYPDEHIIDYRFENLPSQEIAQKTLFVKVTGDSMAPKIEDGDIIQVLKTDSVDSGTIAVIMLDSIAGEEAFVKKVVYGHGWVELHSLNTKYKPMRFEKEDINRIRVLGEVTSITRGI